MTTREKLKGYFAENAIPTAENFQQLIDAALNTEDDRVVRADKGPLQVALHPEDEQRRALEIHSGPLEDGSPAWVVSVPTGTNRDGELRHSLSIKSPGYETPHLFLNTITGGLGVGTDNPTHKLSVNGRSFALVAESYKFRLSKGRATRQHFADDGILYRFQESICLNTADDFRVCAAGGGESDFIAKFSPGIDSVVPSVTVNGSLHAQSLEVSGPVRVQGLALATTKDVPKIRSGVVAFGRIVGEEHAPVEGVSNARSVAVTFFGAFSEPPTVEVSFRLLETSRETNQRVRARVDGVTQESCLILVETWGASSVWKSEVTWIAYGV